MIPLAVQVIVALTQVRAAEGELAPSTVSEHRVQILVSGLKNNDSLVNGSSAVHRYATPRNRCKGQLALSCLRRFVKLNC
jgi:hypothetical protein